MATNNKAPCQDLTEYHIPNDVLEIILSRLPTKSVLRFKAVSKAWNALTLDPRLARIHAYYNGHDIDNLFMWLSGSHYKLRLAKLNNCSELVAVSDLPFPSEIGSPAWCLMLASCDGFFLLYDGRRENYVLWNPITGSNSMFATHWNETKYTVSSHGICYDSLNGDYKVVYITRKWYAVYSCRDRSWTESREFPYNPRFLKSPGVTVRGVSYWIFVNPKIEGNGSLYLHCNYRLSDHETREIVYFDAAECGFKTLHRPEEVRETDVVHLTGLNGRLCLYRMSNDREHLKIWVLTQENNDWIKLADAQDLSPLVDYCVHVKPLYMTEDHGIVLQCESGYRVKNPSFIMYDIRNGTSVRAWMTLDDERMRSEVVPGLGSLVLPTCRNHS